MKNRFALISSMMLLFLVAAACSLGGLTGSSDSDSGGGDSKGGSDSSSSSSSSSGGSGELVKVGIPECDELATYINERAETIGKDSYVIRGIVEMYKQTIFSNLKESVEKMDDKQKARTAENCKKSLKNLKDQMEK